MHHLILYDLKMFLGNRLHILETLGSISKLSLKNYSNTLNSNKYLVSNAIKTPFYCAQNFEV